LLGVKGLSKAFGDLEMSLTHLQQDTDIPQVVLLPHPLVQQVVDQAERDGRKPEVTDFGAK
jgi:dynein heavy chain 1